MQTLLITGGSGFLGRRVAEAFEKEFRVVAPAHRELDITREAEIEALIRQVRPQAVIHCAAMSDVGRSQREPETSWALNVTGARNVAAAAARVGARCLLCSSDQVYFGSKEQSPHRETEKLSPANLYGQEKLRAEQVCLDENPAAVLLRLSWMYDSRTLSPGEHGDFLRTLLGQLGRGEALSFPVYDCRPITDVREVAERMKQALELPGGVYNFGAPNNCSTYVLMQRVFSALGGPVPVLSENRTAFAESHRNLCMDLQKTESFGIRFSTAEEGLVRALRQEWNFRKEKETGI